MSLALAAYRGLTRLAEPLAPALLDLRARDGKEDPERLVERLGRPGAPRPAGPLVWLHGVSVGETLSLLPLVTRLRERRPDLTLLVTSGTVTSAALLAERLPAGVIHQFAPVDAPGAVHRFLEHWRPDVGVLVESEIWPNLICGARAAGVQLALVSARITERSARNWSRFPRAARVLLESFSLILTQDEASAARIEALGGRAAGVANLKLAGLPLACDPGEFARLSAAIGDRAVITAASTHPGEETPIAQAVSGLPGQPLLIVVPRHPGRGPAIARRLRDLGLAVALRSAAEPLAADTQVYVADSLGEMGLFLRLADAVVMGGGFGQGVGGHNPLEPARLGKPTVSGPDVSNWGEVYRDLTNADAARIVETPEDLPGALTPFVLDPDHAAAAGERARRAAAVADVGLDRLWAALTPLLPPGGRR